MARNIPYGLVIKDNPIITPAHENLLSKTINKERSMKRISRLSNITLIDEIMIVKGQRNQMANINVARRSLKMILPIRYNTNATRRSNANRNDFTKSVYEMDGRTIFQSMAMLPPTNSGMYSPIGIPMKPAIAEITDMKYPHTGV